MAIDARERRVVGVMVAKGIGGGEPLPMGSDYHALSHLPGWDRCNAGRWVPWDDAVRAGFSPWSHRKTFALQSRRSVFGPSEPFPAHPCDHSP
jgi:hypothetical protein